MPSVLACYAMTLRKTEKLQTTPRLSRGNHNSQSLPHYGRQGVRYSQHKLLHQGMVARGPGQRPSWPGQPLPAAPSRGTNRPRGRRRPPSWRGVPLGTATYITEAGHCWPGNQGKPLPHIQKDIGSHVGGASPSRSSIGIDEGFLAVPALCTTYT